MSFARPHFPGMCSAPPKSGFSSRLHRRTQFQTLPDARIPAHPAILVLRPNPSSRVLALDRGVDLGVVCRRAPLVSKTVPRPIHNLPPLLGRILPRILHDLPLETARLHPPRSPSDGTSSRSLDHVARPREKMVVHRLLAARFRLLRHGFLRNPPPRRSNLQKAAAYAAVIEPLLAALAVANFLLALGFFFRRRNIAILAAVVPLLAMFALLNDALLFTPVSAQSSRYLADQLRADKIPPSALRVSGIKRDTLYGLDFYLHAELQEWNSVANREVWLLTTSHTSCANIPATLNCENVWERPAGSDSPQLLHLTPIH